jgi:hypothetical protein
VAAALFHLVSAFLLHHKINLEYLQNPTIYIFFEIPLVAYLLRLARTTVQRNDSIQRLSAEIVPIK